MALYFHPTYDNFILGSLMWKSAGTGFTDASTTLTAAISHARAFSIFSGVQPSATNFESNFNTTYRNNHLVHFTGSFWAPLTTDARSNDITQYYMSVLPPEAVAIASGTATWAILWQSDQAYSTISGSIGANFYTGNDFNWGRYIILPVSDNSGNGMIKLTTTNIVSGNSISVQSGGFNLTVAPIV